MNQSVKTKILAKGKRTIDDYQSGALTAEMGYKFRTKAFLEIVFLYVNGVTGSDPDMLGKYNKNTFVNDAKRIVEKIKEQIRLDLKDINFIIQSASSLARFIPKAANRKMLKDNDFEIHLDRIADDAADFGSGFLKVWLSDGKMKMKSVDPYALTWNQWNFKDGQKIERLRKSIRWIVANEKYDATERANLARETEDEDMDKEIILHQSVQDMPDGTQEISVFSKDKDMVFYHYISKEPIVSYYKFDYKKRKGFPDALGIGCYETVFNKLVQSKVNRERMDNVMEIASNLAFQKKMDGERDALVGESAIDLETGVIMGYKENKVEVFNAGGDKQFAMISNLIQGIESSVGPDLNVEEALQGKTLPASTSGVLGTLLSENSSSVLVDVKKEYAKFISLFYKDRGIDYILSIYDSVEDLRAHLDSNDLKLIEQSVIGFMVAHKQIDAGINQVPFDVGLAEAEAKNEIKKTGLISGELLDTLKEEAQGIETFIVAETISKAKTIAFYREIRTNYLANPQSFQDPFVIELYRQEAELDNSVSGVKFDLMLKEIQEAPAQPQQQAQPVAA